MNYPTQQSTQSNAASDFVERFRSAWASRDPQRLAGLLHPDVLLIQPLLPPLRGHSAAIRSNTRFLKLVERLEITIHDSVRRRISYFDPLPLMRAVLLTPQRWTQVVSTLWNSKA